MRVLVHLKAGDNYYRRCYRKAPASCGMLHNSKHMDMLNQIAGQWVEIETEHLFSDQFNTVPIPGVSESGLRLMIADIAAIEGDVRHGVVKCNWCGGYDHNHDDKCDKCDKTDYLQPLKVVQPILPNETATAMGVTANS